MALDLLSLDAAQARILSLGSPLPIEQAPLTVALGRHLAEPVLACRTQPAADLSAMDGYAIRFAELPGPWVVVGESAAGRGLDRALAPGEAARIFTGAPMPEGADTILVQEEATRDGERLDLDGEGPPRPGSSVRRAGSDFADGAVLIEAGALLTPARIALAAIGGHGAVAVSRRPSVAIVSTGDELVPPGAPTPCVMLPGSNGVMLQTMLAAAPADVRDHGIVPDLLDVMADAFAAAAAGADIVVTSGGVSVGDHDLVRPALERIGARLDFWRVAMRPGKPLMAGTLGRTIILGLPGNPVSAFVTGHVFLLPLVRHLAGDPRPLPHGIGKRLSGPLPAVGPRTDLLRGAIDGDHVLPLKSADSAMLLELSRADALIVRAAGSPPAQAGDVCHVLPLA